MATSFLSDSSQDSACSRERSPKSPSGVGCAADESDAPQVCQAWSCDQFADDKNQKVATEDTPTKGSIRSLRHPKGHVAAVGCIPSNVTEAYFIGTPPDSGRLQGKVPSSADHSHNEGKFAAVLETQQENPGTSASSNSRKRHSVRFRHQSSSAVSSLDFGIQHWPASPRDSIIWPRQSAEICSARTQGNNVLLRGQHMVSAEAQLERGAASRCDGSSMSAREQPPAFFCSSSRRTEASSSNLATSSNRMIPKLRKGQLGKASIADLKAAAAALSAPLSSSTGDLDKHRGKSEERFVSRHVVQSRSASQQPSEQALGRNSKRSCSPHSRSPSASSRLGRSSSVDDGASQAFQKVAAPTKQTGNMSDWLTSCTHYIAAAHKTCSSRMPLAEQTPSENSFPSASRGTVEHIDTPKTGQLFESYYRGSTSNTSHSQGEVRPPLANASGSRSVPTPGRPPWGASCGRFYAKPKPSPTTPERGRPAANAQTTARAGSPPKPPMAAAKPSPTTPQRGGPSSNSSLIGSNRGSPTKRMSKSSSSIMRTSLTQRCPSLTRRLGMT